MDSWLDRNRTWFLLLVAVAPAAVAGLLALVRDHLSPATSVLVLVLVVVAVSTRGDRAAGLIAAVSSGVFFDLFLTSPYETLAISDPNDVEAFLLLVAVGVAVTELALWGRRQQARASRSTGYLDGVLSAAESVASRDPEPEDLVALVRSELIDLLGLDDCRFAPHAASPRVVVRPDGTVSRGGRDYDVARHGLPTDEEITLPVRLGGATVGAFVLVAATHVRRPRQEQLRVAVLLADQVGSVVSRSRG
ncbi:MAG: DUF4118 domain-containing protein [Lapillicoccus sp.]